MNRLTGACRAFFLLLSVLWTPVILAQDAGVEQDTANAKAADAVVSRSPALPAVVALPKDTPREALRQFLIHAWDLQNQPPSSISHALDCMDLADPPTTLEQAQPIIHKLERVLDDPRNGVDLTAISDQRIAPGPVTIERQGLASDGSATTVRIEITRDVYGQWRFSRDSMDRLDLGFEEIQNAREAQVKALTEDQLAVAPSRQSPRATLATFIGSGSAKDWASATACLDLSQITASIRTDRGPQLAQDLLVCINRIRQVVFQTLPSDPPADLRSYVWAQREEGNIVLHRIDTEDPARGEWKFTPATVDIIDVLVDALSDKPTVAGVAEGQVKLSLRNYIKSKIPKSLRGTVAGFEYWQWISLLALVMAGVIIDRVVVFLTRSLLGRQLHRRGQVILGDPLMQHAARPLGLVAMSGVWWVGLNLLSLPDVALAWLLGGVKFFAAAAGVWTAYRMADVIAGFLDARARRTASRYDDLLVPLIRKSIKIFVTIFGIVFIAKTMGRDASTFLAGLGIGSLAIGWAAKDSLANILGSVVVLLDRPFHIGDWVIIGDQEGSVESVGFRSTKIRTFYNSIITIPNADCVNRSIDNMGARTYRRIRLTIGVLYATTPEQLEAFTEGIRELIRRHPYTRKDYFHVYVNNFGASSIDIMVYCFLQTPEWGTELRERQRLMLDIMRLARSLGVEFAFPTQTIHLQQSDGSTAQDVDVGSDPRTAGTSGRRQARDIVRTGLGPHGHIPPPVAFDTHFEPLEQASESADDVGDGDGS